MVRNLKIQRGFEKGFDSSTEWSLNVKAFEDDISDKWGFFQIDVCIILDEEVFF